MSKEQTQTKEKTEEEDEETSEKAKEGKEETKRTLEEAEETKAEEKLAPEKKEEEEIVEERIYTVPLGRAWIAPRRKRSPKAMRMLRSFIIRHMKTNEDSIRVTNEVNEEIWSKGIEKPPRRIRIRVTKDTEGIVTVRPVEGD